MHNILNYQIYLKAVINNIKTDQHKMTQQRTVSTSKSKNKIIKILRSIVKL